MKNVLGSNDGFAILYGIVVLLIASLGGASLLHLSQSDKLSAGNYSTMRAAALAARAGLNSFEGQCKENPVGVLQVLNAYKGNANLKWLPAGTAAESKAALWTGIDPPTFSARIMKFDSLNGLIQVQGNGYGGTGGKKSVIGIYQLNGIKSQTQWAQRHAIYLGGVARNFDALMTINGDVYCAGDLRFNGSAGTVINGNLKTGVSTNVSEINTAIRVNGNAYYQTPVKTNGSGIMTINGKAGFEKNLYIDGGPVILGDAYFNSDITGNAKADMTFHKASHSGSVSSARIENAAPLTNTHATINIASNLGMTAGNDSAFGASISPITSGIHNFSTLGLSNFNANDLQAVYNSKKISGALWNDFLVIKVNAGDFVNFADPPSGVFKGKVVWIIDGTMNCNGHLYESGTSSNSLVYVRSGGNIEGLGNSTNFRGYIHVEGSGKVKYQWSGATINGAIHQVSAASGFQMNGGSMIINYDDDVIRDFVDLGIVNPPSAGGGVTKTLILTDIKIRPSLLSLSY